MNPTALRALMICPFLMAVNQFSGNFAVSTYAETIFKSTGSTVDPQMSSIVMAAMQVIGTYAASQLIDRVGRKVLLLVSLIGCFVTLAITGTYSYLALNKFNVDAFNWVPVVSISSFIVLCSLGILPVPYVLMSEVIPARVRFLNANRNGRVININIYLQIRSIGSSICVSIAFICQIIVVWLMPTLIETIHLYGCFWIFAGVSLVGLIFTIFVVKETKGQNLFELDSNKAMET